MVDTRDLHLLLDLRTYPVGATEIGPSQEPAGLTTYTRFHHPLSVQNVLGEL